ncbi:hypothetical protein Tco_0496142 [Tanacetum coccineum]
MTRKFIDLPLCLSSLLQSHEYKQSLSVPFNYALQTGWGQGLAEARSEEELRELMMRMNGFDAYSDKKMNAEYERLFSKTYSYVDRISHLSEKSVQDLLKLHPAPPPKDAPKAGSGGVAFAPKLVRAAEVAGSKDIASQQVSKSKTGPLRDPDRASGVSSQYWKPLIFYDDDDEESSIPLRDILSELPLSVAITPDLPITDSLIMEDEHLNTIPKTESDEENESSVKDLNLTPSESEDLFDIESECDMPVCDNFMTFSNHLFDSNDDFTSSDYESLFKEDVLTENFKIYSNPLLEFDEEIFSSEINPLYNEVLEDLNLIPSGNENDHFNAESNLIESLLNKDTVITFPKIDFLLEEFVGELALINLIPPGIAETNFDPKEDISLIKKLLYDNSSPRPPKELNSEISNAMIETFSSSPILVKDSDSLMEEIDIFLVVDDSIPPGIDSDGYDSEEDNLFLEYEPDPDKLTRVVVEDIFGEPRVHMPNVLPTHPTLCQDLDFTLSTDFSGSNLVVSFPSRNRNKTFDPGISIEVQSKRFLSLNKFSISFSSDPLSPVLETLLPFSFEFEDKVFKHGILVSKEEKSPHLLSHRGFKAFKIIHNFLNESPMMIYGGDMPILDVPIAPDYEDSRARGFVQCSLDLHSFACLFWESYILDLID